MSRKSASGVTFSNVKPRFTTPAIQAPASITAPSGACWRRSTRPRARSTRTSRAGRHWPSGPSRPTPGPSSRSAKRQKNEDLGGAARGGRDRRAGDLRIAGGVELLLERGDRAFERADGLPKRGDL